MKFIHTMKTLHAELDRLYGAIDGLTPKQIDKSTAYRKILEVKAAIKLVEGYDFKLKE